MAHQYMPKIFHGPHKNPPAPPPTYLKYGPLYTIFMRKANLKRNLLNFNTFGSSEYERKGHFFRTVKFCFVQEIF